MKKIMFGTALVAMTVSSFADWAVFEGKIASNLIGDKNGTPALARASESALLVVNEGKVATGNAVLISWTKTGSVAAQAAVVLADQMVSEKLKDGFPVAVRSIVSIGVEVDGGGDIVLLGTESWSARLDGEGNVLSEKRAVSLRGAGVDEEAYSANAKRYNQRLSEQLNAEGADVPALVSSYLTSKKTSAPAGLEGLLNTAAE